MYERKEIKFLGIKIKYKKKIKHIIQFQGILGVNQPYVDKLIKEFKNKKKPIVKNMVLSMTSYPERMKDIHYAIFSILNQSVAPEKFILWLAKDEFPKGEDDIPQTVLQFKKFGLEIRFCEAIRSFKKIIPAVRVFPGKILVTADDDIFYPLDWLSLLYEAHLKNPEVILCHRLHRIKISDNKILPYSAWEKCVMDKRVLVSNFPTSVGGILYPPNSLYKDVADESLFLRLCPNQDDIWVWAQGLLAGRKFATFPGAIGNNLVYIDPKRELGLSGASTLAQLNVLQNQNDGQFAQVINYYSKLLSLLEVKGEN